MFLPVTQDEMKKLGWDALDVILVTGDTYIDSPYIGIAMIGKVLGNAGYRVGLIAQPDTSSVHDISRLGEPKLFWGVSAGCIDSMVANRTATGRKRKRDDYTPGGVNNRRPDRATIIYTNLIRQHFKSTSPIVLGGIEASLRRIPHYDFWSNKIRRSVLIDSKADYLLYGMADRSVVELAKALRDTTDPTTISGLSFTTGNKPSDGIELPPFQQVAKDKDAFTDMFNTFYQNNDPVTAKRLFQLHDNRYLVQNPPQRHLSSKELDTVYNLDYERKVHPHYASQGSVRALDTIRFSVTTHRGCYGECNFCAIAVHQGRRVRWRSSKSILSEARKLASHPEFKGTIHDVGGPTANMYGFECARKDTKGSCLDKRCLYPEVCSELRVDHLKQISLLQEMRNIKGIKRVIVASGVRYNMILDDQTNGKRYLKQIVNHHVSGQMKIAPEHSEDKVLAAMGKPGISPLLAFRKQFYDLTRSAKKKQFLTYYIIAAHPDCTAQDMAKLKTFASKELHARPEQVQVFTPTPSTYSTLMYWTEQNPFTGKSCFVEKGAKGREDQKQIIIGSLRKRRR